MHFAKKQTYEFILIVDAYFSITIFIENVHILRYNLPRAASSSPKKRFKILRKTLVGILHGFHVKQSEFSNLRFVTNAHKRMNFVTLFLMPKMCFKNVRLSSNKSNKNKRKNPEYPQIFPQGKKIKEILQITQRL